MDVYRLVAACFGPWLETTALRSLGSKFTIAERMIMPAADDLCSFSHLHPKLNVPVRTIVVQAIFNLLFGLLYLGRPDIPCVVES
jgi:hypothetical protein